MVDDTGTVKEENWGGVVILVGLALLLLAVSIISLISTSPQGVVAYIDKDVKPPVLVVRNTGGKSILSVDVEVKCMDEQSMCIPFCLTFEDKLESRRIVVIPDNVIKPGDTFIEPIYFHHNCDRYIVNILKVTYPPNSNK